MTCIYRGCMHIDMQHMKLLTSTIQGALYTYDIYHWTICYYIPNSSHKHATWGTDSTCFTHMAKHSQLQLLPHVIAKYVSYTNVLQIGHTCQIINTPVQEMYTYKYNTWSHWHQPFDKKQCVHMRCITEQIWLPHSNYRSHGQHAIRAYSPKSFAYVVVKLTYRYSVGTVILWVRYTAYSGFP